MKYNSENQHTKAYTFASHTSDHKNQSLQKSMLFSDPNKIVFKKFPSLQKNKKYSTHSRHFMSRQLSNDNGCSPRQTRTPAPNSSYKKLAVQWLNEVQFFNQTFVKVESFVLRNRQLLIAAKRYVKSPVNVINCYTMITKNVIQNCA
jgi:hypothetical protein